MAIRLEEKFISKDGRLGFIFSGGGKLAWYPTHEEINHIQYSLCKYNEDKKKAKQ